MNDTLPLIFQENNTRARQVESWEKVTDEQRNEVLKAIKAQLIISHPNGMTSREISQITRIDRTSITGRLSEFADLFDTQLSKYDRNTKRTVTAYRLKELI